jgi:hypothetical protein
VTISGGTTYFASGEPLEVESLTLWSGTLNAVGSLTVSGLTTWTGGNMNGAGTIYVDGGLAISGTGSKYLYRDMVNPGTTTWSDTGSFRITDGATFTNLPGALFDTQNNVILWWIGSPGTFDNQGTFRKSAGTGATDIRVHFLNSDTVEVLSGTLILREGDYAPTAGLTFVDHNTELQVLNGVFDLQGGWLMGHGLVVADVENHAHVGPGDSAGELTIDGDYLPDCDGALVIELGGYTPVTEHDVLAVTGDAVLGGTLGLVLLSPFDPQIGDSFEIITAGNVIDRFECLDAPLPGGNHFAITYGADLVTVAVSSGPPIYGDVTLDDNVDVLDLLVVLAAWGPCDCTCCPADVNGDGTVNVLDLLDVLAAWST